MSDLTPIHEVPPPTSQRSDALVPTPVLIKNAEGATITTSLLVAEYFGKRHVDVVRLVHSIIKRTTSPISLCNFSQSTYQNDRGKTYPMYELTKSGFFFLALGFTGRKAEVLRAEYIEAFDAMEAEAKANEQLYIDELNKRCPCLRVVVEATKQGLNRQQIAKLIGKTVGAVTYWRREARRMGLLPALKLRLAA